MVRALIAVFALALCTAAPAQSQSSPACTDPKHWSGTRNISISVGGNDRTFELTVPFQGHGQCGAFGQYCTGPPNTVC